MKTNWNGLLAQYKGSQYKMGNIVRYAMSLEGDTDAVLALVAEKYPLIKRQGLCEQPGPVLAIAPHGGELDAAAYGQMEIAARLPVFYGGALMPDGHFGYALPIGGVAALENAISPSFVGYDIACRMTLSALDLTAGDLDAAKRAIMQIARFGHSTNSGSNAQEHRVMDDPLWGEIPVLRTLKDHARAQLGTSGSGNHFIDLMAWQSLADHRDTGYALLTHSGSRGVGHKAATYYMSLAKRVCPVDVPDGYAYMTMDSEGGQEYWRVMQLMGRYAQACHHLIHGRFLLAMEMAGINCRTFTSLLYGNRPEVDIDLGVTVDGKSHVEHLVTLENHHNYVWKEDSEKGPIYIHRKGATPAAQGQWGIIPGSSGSNSYVVRGVHGKLQKPEGAACESLTFNSASHGAGRPHSRSQAKKLHDQARVDAHYGERNIDLLGVAADETVYAYKDIEAVMEAQVDQVERMVMMRPIFVRMGGLEEGDDGD